MKFISNSKKYLTLPISRGVWHFLCTWDLFSKTGHYFGHSEGAKHEILLSESLLISSPTTQEFPSSSSLRMSESRECRKQVEPHGPLKISGPFVLAWPKGQTRNGYSPLPKLQVNHPYIHQYWITIDNFKSVTKKMHRSVLAMVSFLAQAIWTEEGKQNFVTGLGRCIFGWIYHF